MPSTRASQEASITLSWTPMVFHEALRSGGFDQDSHPGSGAIRRVEDPHPIVGETQLIDLRIGVSECRPKGLVERVDRAVALAGRDFALVADRDLHRRFGHDRLVGSPLDEGAETTRPSKKGCTQPSSRLTSSSKEPSAASN